MTLFAVSEMKLRRARVHIAELERMIADFNKNNVRWEVSDIIDYPGGGFGRSVSLEMEDTSEEFRLPIGDAIHNIRAALDVMAVEMADLSGEDGTKVSFPFSISRADLTRQIKDKKFNLCGEKAVSLLKEIAPYKEVNEDLRAIHDLDIIDKHRGLTPVPSMNIGTMDLITEPLPNSDKVRVYMEPNLIISFMFHESAGIGEAELIATLNRLAGVGEHVVSKFKSLFEDLQTASVTKES